MATKGRAEALVESKVFENFIILCLILNAATLGMETFPSNMQKFGNILHLVDTLFLSIFIAEMALKIFVYRLGYFKGGWNIFDFVLIMVTLLPFIGNVSSLRSLRILRALRIISAFPSLKKVVEAIISSAKEVTALAFLVSGLMYVVAVIASQVLGAMHPDLFGDLWASMITLSQLATFDDWTSITRKILSTNLFMGLALIVYVIITAFVLLSLLLGIYSNSMMMMAKGGK